LLSASICVPLSGFAAEPIFPGALNRLTIDAGKSSGNSGGTSGNTGTNSGPDTRVHALSLDEDEVAAEVANIDASLATQHDEQLQAGPSTGPLSQLNLSIFVPVTTQPIPLIYSEMLKLS